MGGCHPRKKKHTILLAKLHKHEKPGESIRLQFDATRLQSTHLASPRRIKVLDFDSRPFSLAFTERRKRLHIPR